MGRKSRAKREQRNQTHDPIDLAARSVVVLLLDDGHTIEQLLGNPLLARELTPQDILGIAQLWQHKTPAERAQMVKVAEGIAKLTVETAAGRKYIRVA